jgi:hypothetical protein
VGFEPTIPMFEQAKTFHALDQVSTVIGILCIMYEYKAKGSNIYNLYKSEFFITLAEGRDQWRALVNTIMNLWVP